MLELSVNARSIHCLLPGCKEKELGHRGSGEGGEELFPLQSCLKEPGRDEQKVVLLSELSEPASMQAAIL